MDNIHGLTCTCRDRLRGPLSRFVRGVHVESEWGRIRICAKGFIMNNLYKPRGLHDSTFAKLPRSTSRFHLKVIVANKIRVGRNLTRETVLCQRISGESQHF